MKQRTFTNWDGSLSCQPQKILYPSSALDIENIVKGSRGTVRAFGAGHSWSPLVLTNDTLINLDNLQSLLPHYGFPEQIRVEAGVRLHRLIELADERGLAFKNLGAITSQSITGAISTGTHGTGLNFGCLSTQIVSLTLIDAQGNTHVIDETNPQLLRAARISLGMLGIITEVTLTCVQAHTIEMRAFTLSFDEWLDDLDFLVQSNDHVRFYWYPTEDKVYVNIMQNSVEPAQPPSFLSVWINDFLLRQLFLGLLWKLDGWFPFLTRYFNQFEIHNGFHRQKTIDRSWKQLTTPMPPKHIECEYAVPYENTRQALIATRDLVRKNSLPVNVPSEIRFVKGDDSTLSETRNQDVCFVGAYTSTEQVAKPYFEAFEIAMKALDGRPHWGKRFSITKDEAIGMYGKDYHDFVAVRQSFDPTGRFLNRFLRSLFSG